MRFCFSECPCYDQLIPALLEHGVEKLPELCSLTPGAYLLAEAQNAAFVYILHVYTVTSRRNPAEAHVGAPDVRRAADLQAILRFRLHLRVQVRRRARTGASKLSSQNYQN